jgi:hypothetical protein
MLRRAPKGPKAERVKVEWATDVSYPRLDTIAASSNAGAAGATVDLTVANVSMWRIDDIIFTPQDSSTPPLLVQTVTTATNILTVRALGIKSTANPTGYGTVPAFAEGTIIAWLGNSKHEGFETSYSRSSTPDYDFNFCELSDTIVDITLTRKNTKNYTVHDWNRERAKQLKEFRRSLEYKLWFGYRSEVKDPVDSSKDRWTMHGITRYITRTLEYDKDATGTRITEAMLVDWVASVFSGNDGSKNRILFADTWLMAELEKTALLNRRNLKNTVVLGVQVGYIETSFGKLGLKHHRGFNEMGKDHYGVIVDMEQIHRKELMAMERVPLALKGQGKNKDAEQYFEQATVELRKPSTHAIIEGL